MRKTHGILLLTVSLVLRVGQASPEEPARTKESRADRRVSKPWLDRHGDPLPEGAVARMGTVRFRNATGSITSLRFSADGDTILSVGYDGAVRLWETAT